MPELKRRRLGSTGMYPRALGLGCAHFGRDYHSDRDAIDGVRRAIELGLDYIDTSPAYGESERRVGLALEGVCRKEIYLQTKTGTHPSRRFDYSAEATRWSVANSLRLLRTDYLDAVLIHDPPDIEIPLATGNALDELLKMKQEGIVRHVGLGCRRHDFHLRAMATGRIELTLPYRDYTLLDQSLADAVFPLARTRDVGILLGSVLGMGDLSGREPKEDPRAHAMWQWCRGRGWNVRDLALQFCLALPMDGIILAGPGTMKHVEETYASATVDIPSQVWRDFRAEFGVGIDLPSEEQIC
jgi:aryl-alcohol dehydrogenase-like predicted oxidoreductase